MRIAITGVSGHLGNCVARTLIENDFQIKALIRNENSPSIENLGIQFINGNLFNETALDQLCSDVDILIHIAGKISIYKKDEAEVLRTNIEGVKNVISACKRNGVKKIIHFSSIHAHKSPGPGKILNEQSPYEDNRSIFYNYSKSIGEQMMINARESGLDISIINPTGGFGPFDFQPSLTGKLIINIYKEKLPFIVKGGYDWVDSRDISNVVLSIIKLNISNEKFILSGHWAEFKTLANLVCGIKKQKYKGIALPIWLSKIGLPFVSVFSKIGNTLPIYTSYSLRSIEEGSENIKHDHAKDLFNYSPRPLNESLKDTIDWFKQNNNI